MSTPTATVADVAPLIGGNRAFVRQGLKIMARRDRPGLRALADVARMDQAPTTYALGFLLGPRVNAGGRIGQRRLQTLELLGMGSHVASFAASTPRGPCGRAAHAPGGYR